jgi:hypothetical protein
VPTWLSGLAEAYADLRQFDDAWRYIGEANRKQTPTYAAVSNYLKALDAAKTEDADAVSKPGGMQLKPVSIRLLPAAGPTPHSYAFNCDGLSTLGANPEWGAHTQIWNGANGMIPVPSNNQLINANYGQPISNTSVAKVDDDIYWAGKGRHIHASGLWDLGSGHVRAMQEVPLDADPVLRAR